MATDQNRRDFVRMCGLGLAAGAMSAICRIGRFLEPFEEFMGGPSHGLWVTDLDRCIEPFVKAPTGELMQIYQKFFPVYVERSVSAQSILSFAQLCEQRANQERDREPGGRWHRIHVLPAVAAAHFLTHIADAEKDELRQLIRRVITGSLAPNSELPNREILIIPWQNLICALIKGETDWHELRVGTDLVRLAQETCLWFLNDSRETLPLTDAACLAWQFLLTYEIALKARRRSEETDMELRTVQSAKKSVLDGTSERLIWLATLADLYKTWPAERAQMPPQGTELLLCGQHLPEQYRQLVNFFLMVRVQSSYCDWIMATKESTEPQGIPFVYRSRARAQAVRDWTPTTLVNYGFGLKDWQPIEGYANSFLTLGAAEFARTVVFGERGERSEFQMQEADRVEIIQRAMTKARLEEAEAAKAVFEKTPEKMIEGMEAFLAPGALTIGDRVAALWKPSFADGQEQLGAKEEGSAQDVFAFVAKAEREPPEATPAPLEGYQRARERVREAGFQVMADLKREVKSKQVPVEDVLPGMGKGVPSGERRKLSREHQRRRDRSKIKVGGESPQSPSIPVQWRASIQDYQDEELLVMEFPSGAEISRAVRLIYSDNDLRNLPWDSPDGLAMFVPRESVDLLRSKGLKFRPSELLRIEEIPLEEFVELRKHFGM